jgi:two-component sensor histidine kinase
VGVSASAFPLFATARYGGDQVAGLFVLLFSYRRLAGRLEEEENLRKLVVHELAHRLKNKIVTIQSIISYQLRGQPQLKANIIDRLVALSATDDLIMVTQGRGASIRDVLSTELGAYEVARVSMEGPDIFLPARFAMTLALLIHELATNAAKYGALSSPTGKLSVQWSLSDGFWKLEWRESGGPAVAPQRHRGFGLELLSAGLGAFNGVTETVFEPSGVVCKMKAILGGSVRSTALQVVNEPAASLDPAA